jgi:hypothetical protein
VRGACCAATPVELGHGHVGIGSACHGTGASSGARRHELALVRQRLVRENSKAACIELRIGGLLPEVFLKAWRSCATTASPGWIDHRQF